MLEKFLVKLERDLVGGVLRVMIVAQIGAHGPIHGYALIRALTDSLGGADLFKNSTIYPILQELEREGLVKTRWAAGEAGPQRREYELTPTGRQAQRMAVREWGRLREAIDAVVGARAGTSAKANPSARTREVETP